MMTKTGVLGAIAVILSMSSATTLAENGHAYNGSFCKPYYGSQAGDFIYAHNGIYNGGSGGRYVTCPVIVDEIANTNGTTRVWVHWTAAAASDTLRCTLLSKTFNGGTQDSHANTRTNTGWMYLDVNSDDFWGSYNMYCYLPQRGRIATLWVGEQN